MDRAKEPEQIFFVVNGQHWLVNILFESNVFDHANVDALYVPLWTNFLNEVFDGYDSTSAKNVCNNSLFVYQFEHIIEMLLGLLMEIFCLLVLEKLFDFAIRLLRFALLRRVERRVLVEQDVPQHFFFLIIVHELVR